MRKIAVKYIKESNDSEAQKIREEISNSSDPLYKTLEYYFEKQSCDGFYGDLYAYRALAAFYGFQAGYMYNNGDVSEDNITNLENKNRPYICLVNKNNNHWNAVDNKGDQVKSKGDGNCLYNSIALAISYFLDENIGNVIEFNKSNSPVPQIGKSPSSLNSPCNPTYLRLKSTLTESAKSSRRFKAEDDGNSDELELNDVVSKYRKAMNDPDKKYINFDFLLAHTLQLEEMKLPAYRDDLTTRNIISAHNKGLAMSVDFSSNTQKIKESEWSRVYAEKDISFSSDTNEDKPKNLTI